MTLIWQIKHSISANNTLFDAILTDVTEFDIVLTDVLIFIYWKLRTLDKKQLIFDECHFISIDIIVFDIHNDILINKFWQLPFYLKFLIRSDAISSANLSKLYVKPLILIHFRLEDLGSTCID